MKIHLIKLQSELTNETNQINKLINEWHFWTFNTLIKTKTSFSFLSNYKTYKNVVLSV